MPSRVCCFCPGQPAGDQGLSLVAGAAGSAARRGPGARTSHPWAAGRVSRAQQPALAPSIHVLWDVQTGKRALDPGATLGTKVSSEDVGARLSGRGCRVPFTQATVLGLLRHARLCARLSAAAGGLFLSWPRTPRGAACPGMRPHRRPLCPTRRPPPPGRCCLWVGGGGRRRSQASGLGIPCTFGWQCGPPDPRSKDGPVWGRPLALTEAALPLQRAVCPEVGTRRWVANRL